MLYVGSDIQLIETNLEYQAKELDLLQFELHLQFALSRTQAKIEKSEKLQFTLHRWFMKNIKQIKKLYS